MEKNMVHDVFISYSFKDKEVAKAIASALENHDIRCWYAHRDIQPGENWGSSITHAITKCKIFVLVFSKNSNKSRRVLDELNLAINNEKISIPFRIENLEPTDAMMLNLSSIQWLDAYDPSWEKNISKLIYIVASNLSKLPVESHHERILIRKNPLKLIKREIENSLAGNRILISILGVALLILIGMQIRNWIKSTESTAVPTTEVLDNNQQEPTQLPITQGEKEGYGFESISVRFELDKYNVYEGAGYVTLRVLLSEPSDGSLRVYAEQIPGSAGTDDYSNSFGYINFNTSGQTEALLPLQITNDNLKEGNEYFIFKLSNPVNCVLDSSRSSSTVTIIDDD